LLTSADIDTRNTAVHPTPDVYDPVMQRIHLGQRTAADRPDIVPCPGGRRQSAP